MYILMISIIAARFAAEQNEFDVMAMSMYARLLMAATISLLYYNIAYIYMHICIYLLSLLSLLL